MTAPNLTSVGHESPGPELGQRFIRDADVVECAVDGERGQVFGHVEGLGHVCGVEDEVECEGPVFGPVFVRRGDEFFGAEGEGVGFFGRRVRDGIGFGAEGTGPEEPEVPESAAGVEEIVSWKKHVYGKGLRGMDIHSDYGDSFSGADPGAEEWTPGCEAGAHHWGCGAGGDVLGDGEGEVFVGSDVTGVATLSDCAIWVRGVVRV